MEQLEKAVFNVVNPMFEELVNLVKAAHQGSVDAVTVLGDMLGQTGGTLQIKKVDKEGNYVVREDGSPVMVTPQLYAHKSRIFAHIEGSSFNPEYLMTIREDNDPDWDAEASAEEQAEGEAEAGETEGEVEGEA